MVNRLEELESVVASYERLAEEASPERLADYTTELGRARWALAKLENRLRREYLGMMRRRTGQSSAAKARLYR